MGMPAMPGPGAPATRLRAGPIPGIAIPMFCGMPAVSVAYPAPASHTPAGHTAGVSGGCLHTFLYFHKIYLKIYIYKNPKNIFIIYTFPRAGLHLYGDIARAQGGELSPPSQPAACLQEPHAAASQRHAVGKS